ncbi:amidohydrolase [Aurantimonas sp. VKM B-3413]|uniref:amidohydrolase family protein n=1 Tax=Aurantimonas sp. VKM B-3413 TaxID=2779401 RepID=UPI001E45F4E3|nr:amidohydrolase family protein [Aurantimonas sp. VKM B-3413]MCB8838808.1 amidohydrolase family protein [Aurantimonas sp. VKM B-3413]
MTGRVDAHCHLWQLARGDYHWLQDNDDPALAPIRRDFSPDDLRPLANRAGIEELVVVQAAASDGETDFMLSLQAENPEIAGVVGWVDLSSPAASERIADLARRPALKGIRPMLQDIADPDWLLTAPTSAALATLERSGLRFDALVLPVHLSRLLRFSAAHPDLPIIVDHAAKPALAAGPDDPRHGLWGEGMARIARETSAWCKLSGLLTEMRPGQYATDAEALAVLRPVLDRLLDWFGPHRLVWGSDWPVLTLAAGHERWVRLTDHLLDPLGSEERNAILGGNARRFYGLAGDAA